MKLSPNALSCCLFIINVKKLKKSALDINDPVRNVGFLVTSPLFLIIRIIILHIPWSV